MRAGVTTSPTISWAKTATEDGAGMVFGGSADQTYVQVLARGVTTSLKLSNKDGRVQVIHP